MILLPADSGQIEPQEPGVLLSLPKLPPPADAFGPCGIHGAASLDAVFQLAHIARPVVIDRLNQQKYVT
jgi:hypothetical protein